MKKKLISTFIAIMILILCFAVRFARYYPIAADNYAQQGIKGEITKRINRTLSNDLSKYELTYKQIVEICYDDDGQIVSITINSVALNMIANRLSESVYESISNSNDSFGIPLGNALSSRLFSGKGPKIETEIVPIGAVGYSIESELSDAGINQTLHRIYIEFNTEIKCLSPFHESDIKINTSIIIAETLIVGNVPEIMLPSRW